MLTDEFIPSDADTVAVGPIVWEGQRDAKQWYFSLAFSSEGVDRLQFNSDLELAKSVRQLLINGLAKRRGIVVFDTDDELTLARFCVARWPGHKYEKVVAGIEAEKLAEKSVRH